ncbi:hypothetical protein [Myroides sp. TSA_177.3]|uniref:hypothetical protein n=1 Tax=Myroides sp. TSA_177.3 TaxID=3415650 RepID=UPI004045CA78
MNRYTTCIFLGVIWLVLLFGTSFETYAQDCVYEPDYENAYLNSSNPNTIEYDNMVSGHRATIARGYDGKVMVWGWSIGPNGEDIAPPLELNGDNYGIGGNKLTGSILKFTTGGEGQFAVLTTAGLYIWGKTGGLVDPDILNAANNSFRKVSIGTYNVQQEELKSDGLPQGVQPTAVKMMFGTKHGLAIVTCDGQAWVMAMNAYAYGDGAAGTVDNNRLWHRVSTALDTPLENVVAVRGTYEAFMALTAEGKVYTWGARTFLGDNTGQQSQPFATLMTPIDGVRPKMIGMTSELVGKSYYLLGTNGKVYSLGDNNYHQLGDYTNTARYTTWRNVVGRPVTKGRETFKLEDNIAWISPQEHYGDDAAAINVLTKEGKLWAWGFNRAGLLGTHEYSSYPVFMPATYFRPIGLIYEDFLTAVETGGGNSIIIKQCLPQFGFVGSDANGSMGYFGADVMVWMQYVFRNIVKVPLYGAVYSPILTDRKICNGSTFDLNDAIPTVLPPGGTGIEWWMDVDGTIPVANPEAVTPGTYYGTVTGLIIKCPTAITISAYTASDPEFEICKSYFISNPLVRQLMQNATDATEKRNQFISR